SAATAAKKALYRRLLREFPPISQKRTQQHARLRDSISEGQGGGGGGGGSGGGGEGGNKQLLGQLAIYLRAQRTYTTLLEQYNPSLGSSAGDRVRMSARRVGLDMP
ncbi:hypothetical protein C7212DRAFT_71516, partial [Tuber magnatum]